MARTSHVRATRIAKRGPVTRRLLRNDVDAAVVQGLPDAQVKVNFQAGLLVMKLVRQADAEQVGC